MGFCVYEVVSFTCQLRNITDQLRANKRDTSARRVYFYGPKTKFIDFYGYKQSIILLVQIKNLIKKLLSLLKLSLSTPKIQAPILPDLKGK